MTKATLHRLVEAIKGLTPDEQQQLYTMLDAAMTPAAVEDGRRKALHHALRTTGLVTQVRQRRASDIRQRPMIEVEGKPVSETIIEERR